MATDGGELARQVSSALRRALETGDTSALAPLLAEDAVFWHNSDREELSVEGALQRMGAVAAVASGVKVDVLRHAETPFGYVEQIVLRATLRQTGAAIELYNCLVVTLDGDRAVRVDEYVDPRAVTGAS